MAALHSSLRSSLKNQIGLILPSWVMSDPLGMFVPLDRMGTVIGDYIYYVSIQGRFELLR
jgi:hypothetical protein